MDLGAFVFLTTLSYTYSAWNNNGFHDGRILRYPTLNKALQYFQHPRRFGHQFHHDMHPHLQFGLHPMHNFDHQHHKFRCQYEHSHHDQASNWGSTDTQQPGNLDGEESVWENGSQQFGNTDSNQETNSRSIGEQLNSAPSEENSNGNNQVQGRGQWFWNGQRWVFNDDNDFNSPQSPTTTTWRPAVTNPTFTTTTSGSASPMAILLCMRGCSVTSEYNPVCGSNNITYNNPGRLDCARNCGVDVTLSRRSACPRPTPPPDSNNEITTTTPSIITNPSLPNVIPTSFTTSDRIDINGEPNVAPVTNAPVVTISSDILDNIFTRPPPSATTTTGSDDAEIDIRNEEE